MHAYRPYHGPAAKPVNHKSLHLGVTTTSYLHRGRFPSLVQLFSSEAEVRRVWLKNIAGIYAGQEPEGLSTPLDDLCATIAIKPSGEMITFRLEHINARDTFVMCMMLFAQSQGAEMVGLSHEGPDEEDDGEDLVVEEARLSSAVGSQA